MLNRYGRLLQLLRWLRRAIALGAFFGFHLGRIFAP